MKQLASFVFFCLMTLLAALRPTNAYIDPSSVTYIIQIVACAVITIGAGLGFYFKRLRRYIRKKRREKDNSMYASTYTNIDEQDEESSKPENK